MSDVDPNGSKEPIPFNVSDNYAVHDIIGEGAYGVVVYVHPIYLGVRADEKIRYTSSIWYSGSYQEDQSI